MAKLKTMCLVVVLGIFGIYCRDADAALSQNLDLQGIHINASADGYNETAYANVWGHLEQNVGGRYYQYEYSNIGFYTYEWDPSAFSIYASWNFAIVEEENYTPNFNINASQNSSINVFGISLWMRSNVGNDVKWMEDLENPMIWSPVITDDITFSFSFNLKPAYIENINLLVNEWKWGEDPIQNTLWVSFAGSGQFIAGTEIPEPATMALLGLGGLFLRKKK